MQIQPLNSESPKQNSVKTKIVKDVASSCVIEFGLPSASYDTLRLNFAQKASKPFHRAAFTQHSQHVPHHGGTPSKYEESLFSTQNSASQLQKGRAFKVSLPVKASEQKIENKKLKAKNVSNEPSNSKERLLAPYLSSHLVQGSTVNLTTSGASRNGHTPATPTPASRLLSSQQVSAHGPGSHFPEKGAAAMSGAANGTPAAAYLSSSHSRFPLSTLPAAKLHITYNPVLRPSTQAGGLKHAFSAHVPNNQAVTSTRLTATAPAPSPSQSLFSTRAPAPVPSPNQSLFLTRSATLAHTQSLFPTRTAATGPLPIPPHNRTAAWPGQSSSNHMEETRAPSSSGAAPRQSSPGIVSPKTQQTISPMRLAYSIGTTDQHPVYLPILPNSGHSVPAKLVRKMPHTPPAPPAIGGLGGPGSIGGLSPMSERSSAKRSYSYSDRGRLHSLADEATVEECERILGHQIMAVSGLGASSRPHTSPAQESERQETSRAQLLNPNNSFFCVAQSLPQLHPHDVLTPKPSSPLNSQVRGPSYAIMPFPNPLPSSGPSVKFVKALREVSVPTTSLPFKPSTPIISHFKVQPRSISPPLSPLRANANQTEVGTQPGSSPRSPLSTDSRYRSSSPLMWHDALGNLFDAAEYEAAAPSGKPQTESQTTTLEQEQDEQLLLEVSLANQGISAEDAQSVPRSAELEEGLNSPASGGEVSVKKEGENDEGLVNNEFEQSGIETDHDPVEEGQAKISDHDSSALVAGTSDETMPRHPGQNLIEVGKSKSMANSIVSTQFKLDLELVPAHAQSHSAPPGRSPREGAAAVVESQQDPAQGHSHGESLHDSGDWSQSETSSAIISREGSLTWGDDGAAPDISMVVSSVNDPASCAPLKPVPAADPNDVTEDGVRVLGGKYEVQKVVGEGAYGMVMKCRVRGTDEVVAIKEFKIEDNDPDAEDVKRTARRELEMLRRLSHPNIVAVLDDLVIRDRTLIVMEYVPLTLLELLEASNGGMDTESVRALMAQLCLALAYIHSQGIVYRDIKPENMLVDKEGHLKLCDFGFARLLPAPGSGASELTDYVATRWYRAPELLLGPPFRGGEGGVEVSSPYGLPVDMWAVGCLMSELLTSDPLFPGDSDLDQLYRIQQMLGPMTGMQQQIFNANPHNTGLVFNIRNQSTLAFHLSGVAGPPELDFMSRLLTMDPAERMTAQECLGHAYLAGVLEQQEAGEGHGLHRTLSARLASRKEEQPDNAVPAQSRSWREEPGNAEVITNPLDETTEAVADCVDEITEIVVDSVEMTMEAISSRAPEEMDAITNLVDESVEAITLPTVEPEAVVEEAVSTEDKAPEYEQTLTPMEGLGAPLAGNAEFNESSSPVHETPASHDDSQGVESMDIGSQ